MGCVIRVPLPMNFPARLVSLRKERALSQQRLAELVDLHVNQVRRYEGGTAQPTLDALVSLARALHVSLDVLVFDEAERGPSDDLRLQFEALNQFSPEEKAVARAVLESLILKHDAGRFTRARDDEKAPAAAS